jgi:hypothetical protein
MKIRKKLFSLILLINLTFVFSYSGIIGCGKTKELKQSQTEKNNINKFIPNNKDKVNRLTQSVPDSGFGVNPAIDQWYKATRNYNGNTEDNFLTFYQGVVWERFKIYSGR